jgi:transposase
MRMPSSSSTIGLRPIPRRDVSRADSAGWHGGNALVVPANLTLLPLPPYSPELNPIENLWQFLRHNFLNARVYDGYQAVLDACCDAWNRLCAIPGKVRSITTREWAKTVNI